MKTYSRLSLCEKGTKHTGQATKQGVDVTDFNWINEKLCFDELQSWYVPQTCHQVSDNLLPAGRSSPVSLEKPRGVREHLILLRQETSTRPTRSPQGVPLPGSGRGTASDLQVRRCGHRGRMWGYVLTYPMGKDSCWIADNKSLFYLSNFVVTHGLWGWIVTAYFLTENDPNKSLFEQIVFLHAIVLINMKASVFIKRL